MTGQMTLDECAAGVDQLADAVAWKADNPIAYEAIVAWARADIANGARPAIDLYANLLRRPHFAHALGLVRSDVVYAVNNNLRSLLSRLVMREYPELVFELRRSRTDPPAAVNATPRAGDAA